MSEQQEQNRFEQGLGSVCEDAAVEGAKHPVQPCDTAAVEKYRAIHLSEHL